MTKHKVGTVPLKSYKYLLNNILSILFKHTFFCKLYNIFYKQLKKITLYKL